MSLPHEEACALKRAEKFLENAVRGVWKNHTAIQQASAEARSILRHYPGPTRVDLLFERAARAERADADEPCPCSPCEAERFAAWAARARALEKPEDRDRLLDELRDSIAIRVPRGIAASLAAALEALNCETDDADEDAAVTLDELADTERESQRLNPGERTCPRKTGGPP